MQSIITKNNNLRITVVSYNLYWEAMNGTHKICKKYNCIDNILSNITNTIDYYKPDFICFQEASNYQKIIIPPFYKYITNTSGNETMMTVWNSNKFNIEKNLFGEFEEGRPFCIIALYNLLNKNKILLINIHASHKKESNIEIFSYLQKSLDKLNIKNIKRIIISGDFNRNITEDIKIYSYNLRIKKKLFKFKNFVNPNNTCCNILGYGMKLNYDHIIDSNHSPLLIHNIDLEKWYKKPSSDHVMILGILKN
jgi:endonuclease/exonuclease/phosphatase family metal-dependent hydrolase